jgi:hypothetical protein
MDHDRKLTLRRQINECSDTITLLNGQTSSSLAGRTGGLPKCQLVQEAVGFDHAVFYVRVFH